MKLFLVVVATLVAMAVCGGLAMFGMMMLLMELGTRWHGNYEYYGQYPWLVFGPALVAFLMPAVLAASIGGRRNGRD